MQQCIGNCAQHDDVGWKRKWEGEGVCWLTDGISAIRMVGFEDSQTSTLEKSQGCTGVLEKVRHK